MPPVSPPTRGRFFHVSRLGNAPLAAVSRAHRRCCRWWSRFLSRQGFEAGATVVPARTKQKEGWFGHVLELNRKEGWFARAIELFPGTANAPQRVRGKENTCSPSLLILLPAGRGTYMVSKKCTAPALHVLVCSGEGVYYSENKRLGLGSPRVFKRRLRYPRLKYRNNFLTDVQRRSTQNICPVPPRPALDGRARG